MKRLFCLLLSLFIACSFFGCGAEETSVCTDTSAAAQFDFTATDIDGNTVRYSDFQDAKVIMINFWEPWCNPCLSEMSDIQEFYTLYNPAGLVVLGVFTSAGMDEDIRNVREDFDLTYPLIRGEDENLLSLQTDYVPTTVFVDTKGNILSAEPLIGVQTYEEYENLIREYLQ